MGLNRAIKSFGKGMKEASEIISDMNPDFVIAPMMGSVPLVDSMYVTDINFDPNTVFYMPASSHIFDINAVIKNWITNFLDSNVDSDNSVKIITIDEVVSGGSATRVNRAVQKAISMKTKELVSELNGMFWTDDDKEFQKATSYLNSLTNHNFNNFFSQMIINKKSGSYISKDVLIKDKDMLKKIIKDYFENHITHVGIGVEDSKDGLYEIRPRNSAYLELKEYGLIKTVSVEAILTMDKPEFCPVKYEESEIVHKNRHLRFKPIVDSKPVITDKYLNLLSKISKYVGGREEVNPVSVERAVFSGDYLSTKYEGSFQK